MTPIAINPFPFFIVHEWNGLCFWKEKRGEEGRGGKEKRRDIKIVFSFLFRKK